MVIKGAIIRIVVYLALMIANTLIWSERFSVMNIVLCMTINFVLLILAIENADVISRKKGW